MPPPLPPILTTSLLHSLKTQPHLPPHTWYLLASVTLSVLNRPDEIGRVVKYALTSPPPSLAKASSASSSSPDIPTTPTGHATGSAGNAGQKKQETDWAERELDDARFASGKPREEGLFVLRRIREGLIKGVAIGGLPKAINALLALKSSTPPSLLDPPLGVSPTNRPAELHSMPMSTILHRGQAFFDGVYGKVSKRVMGQMDRSGTEDLGLTARLMYGYLLSNTQVLSEAESSFVLLAGLIPQDVNPQLKGHLKGAVNNGASVEQVRAVREATIRICEASGMTMLDERVPGGWGWRAEVADL